MSQSCDYSENEISSYIVVSSILNKIYQDLITCCKKLLKASDEYNQSMVALETQPCSTLGFNSFLHKEFDHEALIDFQDFIEEHSRNKKASVLQNSY